MVSEIEGTYYKYASSSYITIPKKLESDSTNVIKHPNKVAKIPIKIRIVDEGILITPKGV